MADHIHEEGRKETGMRLNDYHPRNSKLMLIIMGEDGDSMMPTDIEYAHSRYGDYEVLSIHEGEKSNRVVIFESEEE